MTFLRWYQYNVFDLFLLTTVVAVVMKLYVPGHSVTHYRPLVEGTRPGQTWWGNGLDMKFCWCPPGEFRIGNDKSSIEVALNRGQWFGTHLVTQAGWKRVMGSEPWAKYLDLSERFPVGDQHPARFMRHDEAIRFCEKLTSEERAAGRLPHPWKYQLESQSVWGPLTVLPAANESKVIDTLAAAEKERLKSMGCSFTSAAVKERYERLWEDFCGFRLSLVQEQSHDPDQTNK